MKKNTISEATHAVIAVREASRKIAVREASRKIAAERYADMMRQGIWKGVKVKKPKKPVEIVACDGCLDWHPKGKHRRPLAERRANIATLKKGD